MRVPMSVNANDPDWRSKPAPDVGIAIGGRERGDRAEARAHEAARLRAIDDGEPAGEIRQELLGEEASRAARRWRTRGGDRASP